MKVRRFELRSYTIQKITIHPKFSTSIVARVQSVRCKRRERTMSTNPMSAAVKQLNSGRSDSSSSSWTTEVVFQTNIGRK